ncbi:hypothetical protein pb186bvf_012314 [Paramecium bursaria]
MLFPLCSIYYKGSKSQIYNTVDLTKQYENIVIQMTQEQYLPSWKYLKKLNQCSCSPQIHHLGQTEINGDKFYFAVMNKIGPSLKLCFKLLQNKFSYRTIALIAIKMISQIQIIHQNNLVHRKLKLSTIIANNISELYLTNFEYTVKHQQVVINNKSVFQTIHKYSSIAQHLNQYSFPKDDLESVGYILIQLLTNGLFLSCRSQNARKQDKHRYYLELKQKLIPDKYLKQYPECFIYFMNTVKHLNPTDQPPYESLKQQFIYYLSQCQLNFQFDWICIFNQIQQSNDTLPYNVNSAKDFDNYNSPRVRNSSFQSTPPLSQNTSKRVKKIKQKFSIMLPPILEIRESLQKDQISSSSGNVSDDEETHIDNLPQF